MDPSNCPVCAAPNLCTMDFDILSDEIECKYCGARFECNFDDGLDNEGQFWLTEITQK